MYKAAAMRSPHILVVEDDREIRAMVSRFLTKNGCRVTETGDAFAGAGAPDVPPTDHMKRQSLRQVDVWPW